MISAPLRRCASPSTALEVTRFLNGRFYSGTLQTVDHTVDGLLAALKKAGIQVKRVQAETVVYDTAREVDAWWA